MNSLKKKTLGAVAAMSALLAFSVCGVAASEPAADLVVYGKVYTANANERYAEAFAVKDGKYIYVGDKNGASAFVKRFC